MRDGIVRDCRRTDWCITEHVDSIGAVRDRVVEDLSHMGAVTGKPDPVVTLRDDIA